MAIVERTTAREVRMTAALAFLRSYWRGTLVGLVLLTAILGVRGCIQERDARIRSEAVASERLAEWQASNARADSLHKLHVRTDSQVAVAQDHISQLRSRADSLARVASRQATSASIRAASYGDSLSATLDSLVRVVPPELDDLAHMARHQDRLERSAHRDVAAQLRSQIGSLETSLSAADSTSSLWRRRYTGLEQSCNACREALGRAERAIEGRQESGGGWPTWTKLTAGVALLAVGVAVGAGF